MELEVMAIIHAHQILSLEQPELPKLPIMEIIILLRWLHQVDLSADRAGAEQLTGLLDMGGSCVLGNLWSRGSACPSNVLDLKDPLDMLEQQESLEQMGTQDRMAGQGIEDQTEWTEGRDHQAQQEEMEQRENQVHKDLPALKERLERMDLPEPWAQLELRVSLEHRDQEEGLEK